MRTRTRIHFVVHTYMKRVYHNKLQLEKEMGYTEKLDFISCPKPAQNH